MLFTVVYFEHWVIRYFTYLLVLATSLNLTNMLHCEWWPRRKTLSISYREKPSSCRLSARLWTWNLVYRRFKKILCLVEWYVLSSISVFHIVRYQFYWYCLEVCLDLRPVYTTLEFWYGTDKNGTGAIKKNSVHSFTLQFFSRAKQFYFCVWYANQTQMFVQISVSRITSTQYACVLCCFKMADGEFPEEFLFNFFKKRRLPYRKTRTIAERLDKMALFAFGVFALSRLL